MFGHIEKDTVGPLNKNLIRTEEIRSYKKDVLKLKLLPLYLKAENNLELFKFSSYLQDVLKQRCS